MLIEFSVGNFLSFRERQTLSMVASSRDTTAEASNTIPLSLPGLSGMSLVKSAVLYGANASGKSNLLTAMMFMDAFVEESASGRKPDEPTGAIPFLLNKACMQEPSEFEIIFVMDNVRYQYGFLLDNERVHMEWLNAYPEGRAQSWFKRTLKEDGTYEWAWSQKHLKGPKDVLARQTRPNALFLSTAAQFNHEQLRKVYEWFSKRLLKTNISDVPIILGVEMMEKALIQKRLNLARVVTLLADADIGIKDIQLEEKDFDPIMLSKDLPDELRNTIHEAMKGEKVVRSKWIHHGASDGSDVSFNPKLESAGTLRYFSLLGPWLDSLDNGLILVLDELGSNLHPLLIRALLKMLHNTQQSATNPQLVFTTHDVTLLDRDVFRRDQVWLVEKDSSGASKVYPLTDYQPRKDESLAKGYLAGRYGAIPVLTGDLAL